MPGSSKEHGKDNNKKNLSPTFSDPLTLVACYADCEGRQEGRQGGWGHCGSGTWGGTVSAGISLTCAARPRAAMLLVGGDSRR